MRARTSAVRFVSCVVTQSIVLGLQCRPFFVGLLQSGHRIAGCSCGSPPTSFSETSGT